MNKFILIFIPLVAVEAFGHNPQDVSKFLSKSGECDFAAYEVFKSKESWKYNPPAVYCASDLVLNEGTINEKRGCAVYSFNFMNGSRQPISSEIPMHIASGKSCERGGFETVMEMQELPPYQRTLKEKLGPKTVSGKVDRVVVYSKKESYKTFLGYGK